MVDFINQRRILLRGSEGLGNLLFHHGQVTLEEVEVEKKALYSRDYYDDEDHPLKNLLGDYD